MKNKKKILAAALAVCLLGTISYSTLAWFNASQSVTNKFMVATTGTGAGGSNEPAEKTFSLDLFEVVDKNGDGTVDPTNEKIAYRSDATEGWDYEDILPGVEYHKQPIVENTGSYDQYIRVVVTLSNATKWQTVLPAGYDLGKIFLNHDENVWVRDEAIKLQNGTTVSVLTDTVADTISYVYYLKDALAPGSTETLFTAVKLPEHLTQEDMAKLAVQDPATGEWSIDFDIAVRADAIQTKGIIIDQSITPVAKATFEGANWTADVSYADRAVLPTP